MKILNKKAAEVFLSLIKDLNEGNTHIKFDNAPGSFMSLSVELLESNLIINEVLRVKIYSLAHYYEQAGDLIADPEMTFAAIVNTVLSSELVHIAPLTFQNAMVYSEGMYFEKGRLMIRKKVQADMTNFANIWMKNIYDQQLIERRAA
jgi:hypothetical protein